MKKIITTIMLLSAFAFGFTNCQSENKKTEGTKSEKEHHDHEGHNHDSEKKDQAHADFQCPMDCEKGKIYHEAGKCPVCQMDLAKIEHKENEKHEHGNGADSLHDAKHDHKEGDRHKH